MKRMHSLFGYIGKFKIFVSAIFVCLLLFCSNNAYSQIDYSYGRTQGLRLGFGFGGSILYTHYHTFPVKPVLIGIADYNFSPYLSVGVELQKGVLKGVDSLHHLFFQTSTNNYTSINFNTKFSLGFFNDYYSPNVLTDVLKKSYVGFGAGLIHTNITFTYYYPDEYALGGVYGPEYLEGLYIIFPLNVGTNIDVPGLFNHDGFEINPNLQFNYVFSDHVDGFETPQSNAIQHLYMIFSINLKYQF